MSTIKSLSLFLFLVLVPCFVKAQSMIDMGTGFSQQDNFAVQMTYRKQVTPNFRLGVQFQYGQPNYRFIAAKAFRDNGYSTLLSTPLTFRMNKEEAIQLSLFINPGIRFQGIIDPDNNNMNDSTYRSVAIAFEPGLLVNIPLSDKTNFQSGVTFPILFEVKPITLFENQTTLIHAGLSHTIGNANQLFLKANMGPAWGASGDTQKFLYSAMGGVRVGLGKNSKGALNPTIESAL